MSVGNMRRCIAVGLAVCFIAAAFCALAASEGADGTGGSAPGAPCVAGQETRQAPQDDPPVSHAPDTTPPTSSAYVTNFTCNGTFSVGYVAADDTNLTNISLFCCFSADNATFGSWTLAGGANITGAAAAGNFTFIQPGADGYYRFMTLAYDNSSNPETDLPALYDAIAFSDATAPVSSLQIGSPKYGSGPVYVSPATQFNLTAADNGTSVALIWYSLDGNATFNAYGGNFTIPSGTATVVFGAVDAVGNNETGHTVLVCRDGAAPSTTLQWSGPSKGAGPVYATNKTNFTFQAADGLSGVNTTWYQIDTGAWALYNGTPFRILAPGPHTVVYNSTDLVGNAEATNSSSVNIDVASPATALSIGQPRYGMAPVYVKPTTAFNLTATDGGAGVSGIWYRVDGGIWNKYSGNFTIASAGPHALEYNATDFLGNREATNSKGVVVDSAAPASSIAVGAPKHGAFPVYVRPGTLFTISAADSGAGVQGLKYRIDSGGWISYSGSFVVASAGAHTIYYNATDQLGNAEPTNSISIVVDPQPPATIYQIGAPSIAGAQVFITPVTEISLESDDPASGVASIWYRIDAGPITKFTGNFTIPGEGPHTVYYNATDLVGNTEPPKFFNVTVDSTPPSVAPAAGLPQTGASPVKISGATEINITATDGGCGVMSVTFSVDSGPLVNYTGNFTLPVHGLHNITCFAADMLGNAGQPSVVQVFVDMQPPATAAAVAGPHHGTSPVYISPALSNITLLAQDPGCGVNSTLCRVDGGAWAQYGGPFLLAAPGNHTVEYYSTDALGNAETVKSLFVFSDSEGPEASIILGNPHYVAAQAFVSPFTPIGINATDNASGTASVMYRVGGGAWEVFSGAIYLSGPGSVSLDCYAVDNVGNAGPLKGMTLAVDDTAPVTQHVVGTPKHVSVKTFISRQTPIELNSSDSGCGIGRVWYSLDGGNLTAYDGVIENLPSGAHTIAYNATDRLGNSEAPKTLAVYVDATKPALEATVSSPSHGTSPVFVNSSSRIVISASDAESGLLERSWRLAGGAWIAYTGPFTLPFAGRQMLEFRATDNVSNRANLTLDVYLDSTPPTSAMTAKGKYVQAQVIYARSSALFNITSNDAGCGVSSVWYRIDSGGWRQYAGEFSIGLQGLHVIYYNATNNLGMAEQTRQLSVFIDDIAPAVDLIPAASGSEVWVKKGDAILLQGSDSGVGSAIVKFKLSGDTAWRDYAGPITINSETTLTYFAADALGNNMTEASVNVRLKQDSRGLFDGEEFSMAFGMFLLLIVILFLLIILTGKRARGKGSAPPARKAAPAKKRAKGVEDGDDGWEDENEPGGPLHDDEEDGGRADDEDDDDDDGPGPRGKKYEDEEEEDDPEKYMDRPERELDDELDELEKELGDEDEELPAKK